MKRKKHDFIVIEKHYKNGDTYRSMAKDIQSIPEGWEVV